MTQRTSAVSSFVVLLVSMTFPFPASADEPDAKMPENILWRVSLTLDTPHLDPPAVQYAVFDKDPIPDFIVRVQRSMKFNRQQLASVTDPAKTKSIRNAQMCVGWDFGFQDVTGDKVYLLTSAPGVSHTLSSNSAAGKKWVVAKTIQLQGKPTCWCIPFEARPGHDRAEVTLSESNMFDLAATFDNATSKSPSAVGTSTSALGTEPRRPELTKLPFAFAKGMENTPLQYKGRLLLLMNRRDDTKSEKDGYRDSMFGYFIDLRIGEEFGRFAAGHSFVNGFVDGERLHVFASQGTDRNWFQSIVHFWTDDLKTWQQEEAIRKAPDEHLFNSSVCRDDTGFVMAYESNRPVQFCFRFARSQDLHHWSTVPNLCFRGEHNEYSACPAIRYFKPYYYVLYLHAATKDHSGWITYIARSKDLATWELSPLNPVLEAGPGEGINNSDVDLIEIDRKTYLTFATGDQATWSAVRMAMYPGPLNDFLAAWFPTETPCPTADARLK